VIKIPKQRRSYNASIVTKTKLAFPENVSPSGICNPCTMCGGCEIGLKAKTGRTVFPEPFGIAQFAAEKKVPNLEDIQILPEIFGEEVIFPNVKTETDIGGFKSSLPLVVSALGSTKVAHSLGKEIAAGSAKAGIPMVIGENVMTTYGIQGLKNRIKPYLDNFEKFGAVIVQGNIEEIKQNIFEKAVELGANGIEIKLGQGAKGGLGGEVVFEDPKEAEKYRKLGYMIIKRADGKFERHCSPGNVTEKILRDLLVKYSDLKVPIWIKIVIGNGIIDFVKLCQRIVKEEKVLLKAITIDGFGGGTGMSPWLIMNETSLPSISALPEIGKLKLDFDILVSGGFADGVSVAKALMLGAKAVGMGRAFLISAKVAKEKGILNFVKALKEEIQMVCATQRVKDIKKLKNKRENLIALSREASVLFDLKQKIKR
jgi:isopentenyl diphosphate isomerase/L-lactate dehydrogenase-like FMN-dependent dehydrogenase